MRMSKNDPADLTLDRKQEGHTVRGKQPKIRQLRHNIKEIWLVSTPFKVLTV